MFVIADVLLLCFTINNNRSTMVVSKTGFIQGSLSKIQGLFQGILKTILQFESEEKY